MQLKLDEILKLVRINIFLYDILKFALNTRHHTLAKTEQAHRARCASPAIQSSMIYHF